MTMHSGGNNLRVLVVYDNFIAGVRALSFLRRVDGQCGGDRRLAHITLRFDHLSDPIVFELAVKAALTAEILVISAAEGKELPQKVTSWIARCLLTKENRPLAVVASLDHSLMKPDDQPCVLPYLAQIARYGKTELYTNNGDKCEESNSWHFDVAGSAFDSGFVRAHPSAQN